MDDFQIRRIVRDELGKAPATPLSIPLNIDTIFALKNGGLILFGTTTLVAGTIAITDRRIRSTSVSIVSHLTHSTPGTLRSVCADGSLTITSSNAGDVSQVQYFVIL